MEEGSPQASKGYGKRPMWQWVVLYIVIGVIVYGLIYYLVMAKRGGYNSSYSAQSSPAADKNPY